MIHGTMTRAAELLNISQPAISSTIANLEHETGLKLFVRKGGRLQPTPEARLFFVEAERALEAVEKTHRIAKEIRTGKRGHLAVAAYASISIHLLPRLMAEFAKERPGLELKIITRNSQSVRELMTTQQFDLAIAELPLDYPTSNMEVISYECQCMMPIGHPLAALDVITRQTWMAYRSFRCSRAILPISSWPWLFRLMDHLGTWWPRQSFSRQPANWSAPAWGWDRRSGGQPVLHSPSCPEALLTSDQIRNCAIASHTGGAITVGASIHPLP